MFHPPEIQHHQMVTRHIYQETGYVQGIYLIIAHKPQITFHLTLHMPNYYNHRNG